MAPHQKDALMKSHLSRWESSGLTQIAYCREHDIKPHIFSYYKAKVSYGEKEAEGSSSRLIPVDLLSSSNSLTKQMIDSDLIKLSHSNGFSLDVKLSSEMSSLKPLLDLVKSIA
ncbi:hypothetical protein [uncultured Gammaproteobacteria bacterium]|nr:hypothetical protein [uncultured Gammaproteobacteria bacterium]